MGVLPCFLKTASVVLFSIVLWDSCMQAPLIIRAGVIGGASRSGCMLKSWSAGCVVCGPDGSLPKDKLGVGESLQLYGATPGVGFTAAVSQPYSPILIRAFSPLSDV